MNVTHCPNCQTCFKVTPEQLSLYNGKVRCGRCAFVFNAMNHLIEVEDMSAQTLHMPPNAIRQEAPKPTAAQAVAEPVMAPPAEVANTASQPAAMETPQPEPEPQVAPEAAQPEVAQPAFDPSQDFIPRDALAQSLSSGEPEAPQIDDLVIEDIQITAPGEVAQRLSEIGQSDEETSASPFDAFIDAISSELPAQDATPSEPVQAATAASGAGEEIVIDAAPEADGTIEVKPPRYVEPELELDISPPEEIEEQQATRKSRVYRPIVDVDSLSEGAEPVASRARPLWLAGSLIAALLAAAQLAYVYRTPLAAKLPGSKPLLVKMCSLVGCEVPLPADENLISIEGSELIPDPAQPNLIKLSATLRNRAEFEQALPMMELTLTDNNDQTVVRKVFEPAQYLDPSHTGQGIAPNSEVQARLALDVGQLKASGYRLFLFFPQK